MRVSGRVGQRAVASLTWMQQARPVGTTTRVSLFVVGLLGKKREEAWKAKMVEELTNESPDFPSDDAVSVPDIIADLVADTAIPIPAPVRRNFLKAFGQLCSAAIDVPVAHLTGMADERRAETVERIKLINTSGEQIARQMQVDPEYAQLAVQKFGQRVLRGQINLDMIAQRTASDIWDDVNSTDQSVLEESSETINDDWLNVFEAEGRLKSTEEAHVLFGKILAGEIRKPGSFSTRAVRILGSLDHNIASHFVTLCSLGISQLNEVRVPSISGDAGNNTLQQYGLGFDELNLLNEHGLIIPDYNSWREMTPFRILPGLERQAVCVPFGYQGRHWLLMPVSNNVKDVINKTWKIYGVALTRVGRELSKIVEIKPMDEYTERLSKYFEGQGFRMTEVDDGTPRLIDAH